VGGAAAPIAAAEPATSGSPCSSGPPSTCQGDAAAASLPFLQLRQEAALQAVAAEIPPSGLVDAVACKLHELVASAAAVTQRLKRLKTLQVIPAGMYSLNPESPLP